MNNVPAITYELALSKLADIERTENLAGTGHRASANPTGIRVVVGSYLVAIGRRIGGSAVTPTPACSC
ncbi:hypothetical protein BH09CHL1_BH09CHL1_34880 [soil metagenome]